MDKVVRALVAREVAPLVAQCELMIRAEAAPSILPDKRERDAARVDAIMRRARLECVLSELHGVPDRVLRLARERSWWRT